MLGKRKKRTSWRIVAVAIGGSMTFSGLYWNLISEPLGRRIARSNPGLTTERASELIDTFGLLWSSMGLVVIVMVFTRIYIFLARRRKGHE